MGIVDVLNLVGGLALFLFGINLMSDALEKRAGSRLNIILGRLTEKPLKGFLVGVAVTAIIQSSSATTVMLVGFVNSGIMALRQAISVLMGANVGTTITAWILSLTGIQGDSLLVTLLKPSSFTPVLAVIGVIFVLFLKKPGKKDTGMILLGFAVLMFGMETMTGAVSGLSEVPEFRNILTMFSNPVLGVVAGAVLTAIVQSSSASVGILQALSATGQITAGSAIPIIMGQNIGTCITAILSSVGANRNAKRVAVVHLLFNIIGTVFWLSVFYLANAFVHFPFITENIDQVGIAIIHTVFNVLCTMLLFPAAGLLERMATAIVKDLPENEKWKLLDERLMTTPAVAIDRCRTVANAMAELAVNLLHQSLRMLEQYDSREAEQIREGEGKVDIYEDKLGAYLVELGTRDTSKQDSHDASKILYVISDFERISDHAVNILESAEEMHEKQVVFSDAAQEELRVMYAAVDEILELALKTFRYNDLETASRVEPLEQVVDVLKNRIRTHHIERLQNNECKISYGFILSDLLTDLERVSDHCSNIAGCTLQMAQDNLQIHRYLNGIKRDDIQFREYYTEYADKYLEE